MSNVSLLLANLISAHDRDKYFEWLKAANSLTLNQLDISHVFF